MQPVQLQSLTILKSNKAQKYKAQNYKYRQSRCFWELIVAFPSVLPTMFSFSNLTYLGWTFSNTNSIQLAPSDIFAWYEILCCQKLNSKVKCWITNFSLNFLFSFFSTLSQQRIFCHCQNREKIWKTCGEIFIFAKTLAEASNFLGTASGTGLKTGLMGLASKSVHKIPQSPKLSEAKKRRYQTETCGSH